MNVSILTALIRKESLQIIRDPSAILIALVMPLILLFIFGYGVNLDSNRLRVGLVIEDDNIAVSGLVNGFLGSRFFAIDMAKDKRVFIKPLLATKLRGIVIIPQNFSANLAKQNNAAIQVITDGSEPNIAAFVYNYSRGVIDLWLSQQYQQQSGMALKNIELQPRYWYNPELKSRNFLVPGSIAIVMTLIGTLLTALVIAREWERGTMEAMLATPVTNLEIILGKLVPYFILGMGSMLVCLLVAIYLFHVPFRGSFLALGVCSAAFLIASLGQGLLISSVTGDQFVASQAAIMSAFLPAFMLSGFIFEISAMPWLLQKLTYLFIARYFVTELQTIFLVGNIWPLLIRSTLAILFIGSIFFLITAKKTRKRLE